MNTKQWFLLISVSIVGILVMVMVYGTTYYLIVDASKPIIIH